MTPECRTCGRQIRFAGRCEWCLDVETSIDEYLKSRKGREFIREKMKVCDEAINAEMRHEMDDIEAAKKWREFHRKRQEMLSNVERG